MASGVVWGTELNDKSRAKARTVACSVCDVPGHQPCRTLAGGWSELVHRERWRQYSVELRASVAARRGGAS